ncbi:MAG: hypothetical protein M1826_003481 [Phylliscum demangeonii]|nr:MAG: hypothetical protein M1826_003481 [Phylliscum demangeonii]
MPSQLISFHKSLMARHRIMSILEEQRYLIAALHRGKCVDEHQGPPPPATPLDFPQCTSSSDGVPFTKAAANDLYQLFSRIQKPLDVSREHIDALNLRLLSDQPLEEMIPWHTADKHPYLPAVDWDKESTDCPPRNAPVLSNGRDAPGPDLFAASKTELMYDNDDVFRTVQRLPPLLGKLRIKPTSLYKFWQRLFLMAQYWDTSLDDVYEYEDEPEGKDGLAEGSDVKEGEPRAKKYKGRRTGAGKEMPDFFREEVVGALVDEVMWLFGCQVSPPRLPPRLTMRTSYFSIRMSFYVYRSAVDRLRARQGFVEGPMMGLQIRPETSFRQPGQAVGAGQAEMVDLLREVAALLLLAQERARDGQEEKKPGEGKWYTSKPRWGGGLGGEVSGASGQSAVAATGSEPSKTEEPTTEALPPPAPLPRPEYSSARMRHRKASAAAAYKKLWPGTGTWDRKVTYTAIGKEANSNVDHVFLLSSINHHVALLRLRVHQDYLAFLETGHTPPPPSPLPTKPQPPFSSSPGNADADASASSPAGPPPQPPWYVLEVRRSRWYDLLAADDRVDVFRGLWGIAAWLMRDTSTPTAPVPDTQPGGGDPALDAPLGGTEDVVMSD